MNVKNIIFDLGGVLLEIDYQRTVDAFVKLGLNGSNHSFNKERQTVLFQTYEKGKISDEEFIATLAANLPGVAPSLIRQAWCALLGDMPIERMQLLEKLAEKHRLFVLSNTNHIHQVQFEQTIDQSIGWERFSAVFDQIGYSHELGLRKPEVEIFEKMLRLNGLIADETFFVDDTEDHVESARSIGLQARHLLPGETILDIFREW